MINLRNLKKASGLSETCAKMKMRTVTREEVCTMLQGIDSPIVLTELRLFDEGGGACADVYSKVLHISA